MTEHTYSIDLDLKEVTAMVDSFVPYIYEDELYGRVGMNLPRLTPGAVLLRLRRLNALRGSMNANQITALDTVTIAHNQARNEWGVAYAKKLTHEAESRLRDIQIYVKECRDDPRMAASAYLPEALRRTMVQEVLTALGENASGLKPKVRQADSGLRNHTQPCPFLWDAVLQPIYPQAEFWWLYVRPLPPE